jgi:Zn-dependent peptidase ImmA (M78 family)
VTSVRFANIRTSRKYVRSLRLEPYASAYELFDQMSSLRVRPIRVVEWPLVIPGPMGVWIAREEDDIVVVQEMATGRHRDHILLHELAHILCDHEGEPMSGDGMASLPLLGDESVEPRRLRSVYDSAAEREAELLAAAFAERLIDDDAEPQVAWDMQRYFAGD